MQCNMYKQNVVFFRKNTEHTIVLQLTVDGLAGMIGETVQSRVKKGHVHVQGHVITHHQLMAVSTV